MGRKDRLRRSGNAQSKKKKKKKKAQITTSSSNKRSSKDGDQPPAAIAKQVECTACGRRVVPGGAIACPVAECSRVFCTEKCAGSCIVRCANAEQQCGGYSYRCRPCAKGTTLRLLQRLDPAAIDEAHRPFAFCDRKGCKVVLCPDCPPAMCSGCSREMCRCLLRRLTECSRANRTSAVCTALLCSDCDGTFDIVDGEECCWCIERLRVKRRTDALLGWKAGRAMIPDFMLAWEVPLFYPNDKETSSLVDARSVLYRSIPEHLDRMQKFYQEKRCSFCFIPIDALHPEEAGQSGRCGDCKAVYYCDQVCQRQDWLHHREYCKSLREGRNAYNTRSLARETTHGKMQRHLSALQDKRRHLSAEIEAYENGEDPTWAEFLYWKAGMELTILPENDEATTQAKMAKIEARRRDTEAKIQEKLNTSRPLLVSLDEDIKRYEAALKVNLAELERAMTASSSSDEESDCPSLKSLLADYSRWKAIEKVEMSLLEAKEADTYLPSNVRSTTTSFKKEEADLLVTIGYAEKQRRALVAKIARHRSRDNPRRANFEEWREKKLEKKKGQNDNEVEAEIEAYRREVEAAIEEAVQEPLAQLAEFDETIATLKEELEDLRVADGKLQKALAGSDSEDDIVNISRILAASPAELRKMYDDQTLAQSAAPAHALTHSPGAGTGGTLTSPGHDAGNATIDLTEDSPLPKRHKMVARKSQKAGNFWTPGRSTSAEIPSRPKRVARKSQKAGNFWTPDRSSASATQSSFTK